jgi:hypothetical protein
MCEINMKTIDMKPQKIFSEASFLGAMMVGLLIPPMAHGATLVFSQPDFEWHLSSGLATPFHIYSAGDFWAQNFSSTGLAEVNQMSLTLQFNSETTPTSSYLNLGVLLNGFDIGELSVQSGDTGLHDYQFSFDPVSGPDYRLELLALNSTGDGGGAVSLAIDGNSYATIVAIPEPEISILLVFGTAILLLCRQNLTQEGLASPSHD